MYSDPFNVDYLEKTPESHPSQALPEPTQPTQATEFIPGIYRNCYICGIEAARLPQNSVVTLAYTKSQTASELKAGAKPVLYALTFCRQCYDDVSKQ